MDSRGHGSRAGGGETHGRNSNHWRGNCVEQFNPGNDPGNIDWTTLKNARKPIALALRVAPYPGPFSRDDHAAKFIAEVAKSLLTDAASHQLDVSEFQFDFDCAQKKLNGYSLWLQAVRAAVRPTRFVITTLPAWLSEAALASRPVSGRLRASSSFGPDLQPRPTLILVRHQSGSAMD